MTYTEFTTKYPLVIAQFTPSQLKSFEAYASLEDDESKLKDQAKILMATVNSKSGITDLLREITTTTVECESITLNGQKANLPLYREINREMAMISLEGTMLQGIGKMLTNGIGVRRGF